MNETWCSLAWNHHFIGPGGNCKPCCRFKGQNVPKDNNLNKHDIHELFNNEFMNDIRKKMILGEKVEGCAKCYEEQESGKKASLREIYNKIDFLTESININTPKITFLESAFSNICDIQCVMCAPYFSTSWSKQDLSEISDLVKPYKRVNIDIESIKEIIPNLIHLKFTGGEPLLIPEYKLILEERTKHGNLENVFLNYSTNLMRFPDDKLLSIWKKAKFVEIAASFDGVGKTIEYVRYPSKWNVVEENLIKYMQLSKVMDLRIGMRTTVMPYNVLNLPEMTAWWIDNINEYHIKPFNEFSWFNPTHVAQPAFLTLKILPERCKEIIKEKLWNYGINKKITQSFNHLCNYMYSEDHSEYLETFKRYTKVMDKRGIKFKDICEPEFYNEIF